MKKTKNYFVLAILGLTFAAIGCSDEQQTNTENVNVQSAKSSNRSEPIEVTNFKNKMTEISKIKKRLTDSEKAELLYPEAKAILEIHGLPEQTEVPKEISNETDRTSYLGVVRFLELIKN